MLTNSADCLKDQSGQSRRRRGGESASEVLGAGVAAENLVADTDEGRGDQTGAACVAVETLCCSVPEQLVSETDPLTGRCDRTGTGHTRLPARNNRSHTSAGTEQQVTHVCRHGTTGHTRLPARNNRSHTSAGTGQQVTHVCWHGTTGHTRLPARNNRSHTSAGTEQQVTHVYRYGTTGHTRLPARDNRSHTSAGTEQQVTHV